MSRARAPLYFTYRLDLDSSLSRRLIIPPFYFMTVTDTNANIDNISVAINDLERVRLRDIIPLELRQLARSMTVYWSPSEVGKYVVFLFSSEYRGFRTGLAWMMTLQKVRDILKLFTTTIFIDNGLNQSVSVQIKGNRINTFDKSVNIGSVFDVPADSTDSRTLTPDTSGWLPYITVSLRCSVAPTSGSITVYMIYPDRYEVKIVDGLAIRDINEHNVLTDPDKIFMVSW